MKRLRVGALYRYEGQAVLLTMVEGCEYGNLQVDVFDYTMVMVRQYDERTGQASQAQYYLFAADLEGV
jgi:uncharacterized protein with NAD-binding domain and iron-sulfur cluster